MLNSSIISFPVPNRDIVFRLLDNDTNRFKIYTPLRGSITQGIDHVADCSGDEFATIIRRTLVDIEQGLNLPPSDDYVTRCCDECLSYAYHESTCSQNPTGPLMFDGTIEKGEQSNVQP